MGLARDKHCQDCIKLLDRNDRQQIVETLEQIGDANNKDWCRICDTLFCRSEALNHDLFDVEIVIEGE